MKKNIRVISLILCLVVMCGMLFSCENSQGAVMESTWEEFLIEESYEQWYVRWDWAEKLEEFSDQSSFNEMVLASFEKMNDEQLVSVLSVFDTKESLHKSEFLDYAKTRFDYSEKTFEEKLDLILDLSDKGISEYYQSLVIISQEEFGEYIAEKGEPVYTDESKGYYAGLKNSYESEGTFEIPKTTTVRYLGDFKQIEIRGEYLNSYYEIEKYESSSIYFRDVEIRIESIEDLFDLENVYYSAPYFFKMHGGEICFQNIETTDTGYFLIK